MKDLDIGLFRLGFELVQVNVVLEYATRFRVDIIFIFIRIFIIVVSITDTTVSDSSVYA